MEENTETNSAYSRYESNITNLVKRVKTEGMTYGEMSDSLQCILESARHDEDISEFDMFTLYIHYYKECGGKL